MLRFYDIYLQIHGYLGSCPMHKIFWYLLAVVIYINIIYRSSCQYQCNEDGHSYYSWKSELYFHINIKWLVEYSVADNFYFFLSVSYLFYHTNHLKKNNSAKKSGLYIKFERFSYSFDDFFLKKRYDIQLKQIFQNLSGSIGINQQFMNFWKYIA